MNDVTVENKQIIAEVHGLSHEGRGIATVNNKITFITGALPGEVVSLRRLNKRRNKFNEADVEEVITPSPDRITPLCEHYGTCGGCRLQHLSSQLQIEHKQAVLLEQLQHFAKLQPETILPPLMGPNKHYRRKARIGVKYVIKKEAVLVGFREMNGRYIANLNQCPVLHPSVGEKITALKEMIVKLHAYQVIPQLEVAIGDEQTALIVRHLETLDDHDLEILQNFATEHNIIFYLQPKGLDSIHKLGSTAGQDYLSYRLPELNLEYLFYPTDFTQVNAEINRSMIQQALTLLDLQSDDTVLDLFCGLGNFSLAMAKFAKHVVGVEGNEEMVKRAKLNAEHNDLSNAEFHAADLNEPLTAAWAQQKFSKILLDPARAGAANLMEYIENFQAQRIVYVSCNPATLARDAGLLAEKGYKLMKAGVMDMFPHTSHVESIAVFDKK